MPKEVSVQLTDKAVTLLTGDAVTFLSSLSWAQLSEERFCQLIEMQAEAWCRVTRLRLLFDDTVGAQVRIISNRSEIRFMSNNISDDSLPPRSVSH